MLEATGNLVLISRQLSHQSVAITADLYGAAAEPHNFEALTRLQMQIVAPQTARRVDVGRLLTPTQRAPNEVQTEPRRRPRCRSTQTARRASMPAATDG